MAVSEKRDQNAKNPQDIINLICGVLLFISPWVANFAADSRAAWTGWIGGVVIAVMAAAALLQFAEWEEWVALVIGVLVVIAPWVLGFAAVQSAAIVCVVLGIIVALSSIWELWTVRHQSHQTA
jgi:uncharacterized membrane protein HdeD (DUF308 family)